MKKVLLFFLVILFSTRLPAQSVMEDLVQIDHSWVQGSYWSPSQYPGWGFLVDVQGLTMFGAVYGYIGDEPSFVVFVGSATSIDPLVFQGDVYFVIEPGVEEVTVGTFTWETSYAAASPAARLSISSNILNVSNLPLTRFAYADVDEIDTITGGDWSVVRRLLGLTFGDHYAITDRRFVSEGTTFVEVVDLGDQDMLGVAAYFPPPDGDAYGMLVQFDDDTSVFYMFFATNSNMFGRYWFLDDGEDPVGNGNFFRGVSDTLQTADYGVGGDGDPTSATQALNRPNVQASRQVLRQLRALEVSSFVDAVEGIGPTFPEEVTLNAFRRLSSELKPRANFPQ